MWCWHEPGTLASASVACTSGFLLVLSLQAGLLPQKKGPSSPLAGSEQPGPFAPVLLMMRGDGRQDHRASSLEALSGRELTESGGVKGHGMLWKAAPA